MPTEVKEYISTEFGSVRTAFDEKGDPLFCLVDVARALEYARPADAVTAHCKGVAILPTPKNYSNVFDYTAYELNFAHAFRGHQWCTCDNFAIAFSDNFTQFITNHHRC